MATNKDPAYTQEPRRLIVIETLGGELGKYTDSFKSTLSQRIKDCSIQANYIMQPAVPAGTAVNEDVVKAWREKENAFIRQFGPDTLLGITQTRYTRRTVSNQYGVLSSHIAQITYELELFDVRSNKTVWKALVTLDTHFGLIEVGDAGAELANTVIGKLEQDQIFHACPRVAAH